METFVWHPRYDTGLAEVDAQHRRLVGMINAAARVRDAGGSGAEIQRLLEELGDYAAVHFATEEALMAESRCDPRHAGPHGRAHREFFEHMTAMRELYRQDPDGMTTPLLSFVASWLAHHLVGIDQVMGWQIAAIRAGMDPADAHEQEAIPEDTATGVLLGALSDLTERLARRSAELARANQDLEERVAARTAELAAANARLEDDRLRQAELIRRLEETQSHLMQSEKMAAIGQLAAGVAHEINNPVGFVNSNLGALRGYVATLLGLIDAYGAAEATLGGDAATRARLAEVRRAADLEFLRQDLVDLLAESQDGLQRVKRIVEDLKGFSRADSGEWQEADLNAGLDSTLNVVWNELKYKAQVVKEYGELPLVRCIGAQLNQVFMNLLVNAGQAIESSGCITLRTGADGARVWVEVEDTGKGIPPDVQARMFEPFFTTKPVGKGTGLGLSVSYGIVSRHGGSFEVHSTPGRGSTIRVWLPVGGPASDEPEAHVANQHAEAAH